MTQEEPKDPAATEVTDVTHVHGLRRRGRRVTTEPAPGTDPTPAPVDRRHDSSDNDARLKADKPPHWG